MPKPFGQVVLLDEAGQPTGVAPKETAHTSETALHLGFSCHVFNPEGQVLLTRRSLHKRSWPGVWTNSFCGHPQPDESVSDAVVRHGRDELGLHIAAPELVLPNFRYRASDASGVVENEICPVFTAVTDQQPQPNPNEVCELAWTTPVQVATAVEAAPWAFSPWLVQQLPQLEVYTSGHPADSGRVSG